MKCVECGETINPHEPHTSFAANKKWHQECWGNLTRVGTIRRTNGVAGQFSYTANVTYPGEDTQQVVFVSSVFGGGVDMVLPSGVQTRVDDPSRFGDELNPKWVRRFFHR